MKRIENTRKVLAELDLEKLPKMELKQKKHFPKVECVYIARTEQTILYVGKTHSLYQRWAVHHRLKELMRIENVYVQWIDCTDKHLNIDKLEEGVIVRLSPTLNDSRLLEKDIDTALSIIKAHGGFTVFYGERQVV